MNTAARAVLVTSAAKKVPLVKAVQSAARKMQPQMRVMAGDTNEAALARYVADEFWCMPRTHDDEVDALLAGCQRSGVSVVIPTRDGELSFWAQHRAMFAAAGIDVIVSPAPSVAVCLDKLAFARFGAQTGLSFISAAGHPDEVGAGPYVVKERYGAGARCIGVNLGREQALTHGASMDAPIYQPFVSGTEISVDAWLDSDHRVKGVVLRTRDHVVGGESQVTTTFRDEAIEREVTAALNALKLRGPVVLQAIVDANRRIHVIECNTRFGGASTASITAGLDVFYWSLLEAQGADLRDYPFIRVSGEVRQIRVAEDIHEHGPGF